MTLMHHSFHHKQLVRIQEDATDSNAVRSFIFSVKSVIMESSLFANDNYSGNGGFETPDVGLLRHCVMIQNYIFHFLNYHYA